MKRRHKTLLGVGIVVSTASYRSIAFWTRNSWDIGAPDKILMIAAALAVIAVGVLLLLARVGLDPITGGLAIGALLMLLAHWQELPGSTGLLLVGIILILTRFGQLAREKAFVEWLAVGVVAAIGVVPIGQLVTAHVANSAPYPLVDLPSAVAVPASGLVEDVIVVIVDTYPNLRIAESWFGHTPDALIDHLTGQGFTVPSSAWSRHTFTSLSVSSMLELTSVVSAGPTEPWGNRSSLWRILRGDNLVSQTLKAAGFRYTHVESGWEGTACGPIVDACVRSPWLDEQVWDLLKPTVALDWIEDRHHVYTGTVHSASWLQTELPNLISNDSHDFVFAHFLMPHEPFVTDPTCRLRRDPSNGRADRRSVWAAFGDQMACVDRLLISSIATDDDTAFLLTGDHGSSTGGQVYRAPSEWSDADIAERFGVFTAYKVPAACDPPSMADPVVIMATLLSCAVDADFASREVPIFLVGFEDPEPVRPERMDRIQRLVDSGSMPPPEQD